MSEPFNSNYVSTLLMQADRPLLQLRFDLGVDNDGDGYDVRFPSPGSPLVHSIHLTSATCQTFPRLNTILPLLLGYALPCSTPLL